MLPPEISIWETGAGASESGAGKGKGLPPSLGSVVMLRALPLQPWWQWGAQARGACLLNGSHSVAFCSPYGYTDWHLPNRHPPCVWLLFSPSAHINGCFPPFIKLSARTACVAISASCLRRRGGGEHLCW